MAASFLHGAEVIEVTSGPRPITSAATAIVGLLGIAQKGAINTPVLVNSLQDAAQFGLVDVPGFGIPQAISAIFAQGPATIVVVNVFDPEDHSTAVSLEAHTVTNRKVKLGFAPVSTLAFFQSDGTTGITLVLGTDYKVDDYGNVTFISNTVADATAIKITYGKLNASAITTSVLLGTVDEEGVHTGLECFDLCYSMFGFNCKILISPNYSPLAAIASGLETKAIKYKAVALIDAPTGTDVPSAIAGRGPSGSMPAFNTSSNRALLCYPMVKTTSAMDGTEVVRPYSSYLAGVGCEVDNNEGYWISWSNHEIQGITGLERIISAAIDDATCDANQLNQVGIVTIFNGFGTGYRVWGNRSAAFPSSTFPDNFYCVRRTADMIQESLIYAMLQFIDKPINQAVIDAIRESCNQFIRTLISRGALVDGSCAYDPNDNPPVELAAGHLTFNIDFMPPTPAERITFKSFIDINLLASLK